MADSTRRRHLCVRRSNSLDNDLVDRVHDPTDSRRYLPDGRIEKAPEVTEKRADRTRGSWRHRGLGYVHGHGPSERIESDRCKIDGEDVASWYSVRDRERCVSRRERAGGRWRRAGEGCTAQSDPR
jgi:hypothetical protein